MFKIIRMVKRGDKLPAEFRQEWLERNRELRKTASKLVASVAADGKVLGEDSFDGMSALTFNTIVEAKAAEDKTLGKGSLSAIMSDERVLFERMGVTLKPLGQIKVVLTGVRKKDMTPAQFKDASLKGYAKCDSKTLMDSLIQKIVVSFAAPEDKDAPFDCLVEIYFASTDEVKATFASPVIGVLRKDEETLVDLNAPEIRIVAEEHNL